jgi:hypothetical protein
MGFTNVLVVMVSLGLSMIFWANVDRFTEKRPAIRALIYSIAILYVMYWFFTDPIYVLWVLFLAVFVGAGMGYGSKAWRRWQMRDTIRRNDMGAPYDDGEWCSIYGYDIPEKHACSLGICYNPYRDNQRLQGTLKERQRKAKETAEEMRNW